MFVRMHVCASAFVFKCVCVCVCERTNNSVGSIRNYTQQIYIYIYIYTHTHISYICCFGLGSGVSTVCMPSHRNIIDLGADNTGLAAKLRGLMQDVEVFIARIGFEVYHSISICGLQGPVY